MLQAQDLEPYSCLEECMKVRESQLRDYRECEDDAEKFEDRMAIARHKQLCRKRFPLPECSALAPCQKLNPKSEKPADTQSRFTIRNLTLAKSQGAAEPGVFHPGDQIVLRYEVFSADASAKRWFDQNVVILDDENVERLSASQAIEKTGTMTANFAFKSDFSLSKDFPKGHYRLQLRLRERYSGWQGQSETAFSVRN